MKYTTKNNRIFFRADASAHVGLGHISRLLAFSEITKEDFTCFFITHHPTPAIEHQILALCHECIKLPSFEDVASEAHFILKHILKPGDVFVLDGYQFTATYQQIIRSAGVKVICMDDLHQTHFYADVVINPAGGVSLQAYEGEIYTRYGLGPAYAPLRSPFRKAVHQRRQRIDSIEQIFICLGGSDYHNLSEKTVKACLPFNFLEKIHIVIGSAYRHASSLQILSEKHPGRIIIHHNLNAEEMVQLMQICQLAIAPASTIAYELCMVGIGLITGMTAENQRGIAHYLSEAKCAVYAGDFIQISEEDLQRCIASFDIQTANEHLQYQSNNFFDNTAKLLTLSQRLALENQINIRRARQDDMLTYFHWANEPETRKQAIHPDYIPLETHTRWFHKKISNPEDFLFIFTISQQPLGQVRFEPDHDAYVISFSVDKAYQGQGLGSIIIKMALEALQQALGARPKVKAYVKPSNTASLHIFRQNAFMSKGEEIIDNVLLEKFVK